MYYSVQRFVELALLRIGVDGCCNVQGEPKQPARLLLHLLRIRDGGVGEHFHLGIGQAARNLEERGRKWECAKTKQPH